MNRFVFATVIKEIKSAWKDSEFADPVLIELLYDSVAIPTNISNKKDDAITVAKSTASKIINRQKGGNPLKIIREHSADQVVLNTIDKYFQEKIVAELLPGCETDLIHRLMQAIEKDETIADKNKQYFHELAQKNTPAKFLASAYLYSLKQDNVLSGKSLQNDNCETIKHRPLQKIDVAEDLSESEKVYTKALFRVYAQKENVSNFSEKELPLYPKYQKHFKEQRTYYFAAEAVRRGTRDIYSKENQFDILKDETYEGVKEVWEEQYQDGLTRLRRVRSQASATRVDRCMLSNDTTWIGNPQKKGVCHFLVNDNRLEGWVRDDDGEDI